MIFPEAEKAEGAIEERLKKNTSRVSSRSIMDRVRASFRGYQRYSQEAPLVDEPEEQKRPTNVQIDLNRLTDSYIMNLRTRIPNYSDFYFSINFSGNLNLESFTKTVNYFLITLVKEGYGEDLVQHIPEVKLPIENKSAVYFLVELIHNHLADQIYELISFPSIDLRPPLDFSYSCILSALAERGYLTEVKDLITNNSVSLQSIGSNYFYLLKAIAKSDPSFVSDIVENLTIEDINNITFEESRVLGILINNQYPEKAIKVVSQSTIYLESVSESAAHVLIALIDNGNAELVKELIKNQKIKFNLLSDYAVSLLISFLKKHEAEFVFSTVDLSSIDFNLANTKMILFLEQLISMHFTDKVIKIIKTSKITGVLTKYQCALLRFLVVNNHGDFTVEIIKSLPITYELFFKNEYLSLLFTLSDYGFSNDILELLPKEEIDLLTYNTDPQLFALFTNLARDCGQSVVASLIGSKFPNLVEEYPTDPLAFNKELDSVREPIKLTDAERPQKKVGPTTLEMIKELPLDVDGVKSRGSWVCVPLKKRGSVSKVWIRFPEKTTELRIVFRTDEIPKESINAYKVALKELPLGITQEFYPELLTDDRSSRRRHINRRGFREVFAGPEVASLNFETLPDKLKKSIEEQLRVIFAYIVFSDVNHLHPHNRNFNVRFLLSDSDGNKQIIFDPNKAINFAIEQDLEITPIVNLRDWDDAHFYEKV